MKFFKRLFRKKAISNVPALSPWETTVEMMYDKYLDAFSDKVVNVIYSNDKSLRYVILKDEKGFYTYQIEAIYQLDDDDEWKYICSHDTARPAMWKPFKGIIGSPFFENIDELMEKIQSEPEYKQYFV